MDSLISKIIDEKTIEMEKREEARQKSNQEYTLRKMNELKNIADRNKKAKVQNIQKRIDTLQDYKTDKKHDSEISKIDALLTYLDKEDTQSIIKELHNPKKMDVDLFGSIIEHVGELPTDKISLQQVVEQLLKDKQALVQKKEDFLTKIQGKIVNLEK